MRSGPTDRLGLDNAKASNPRRRLACLDPLGDHARVDRVGDHVQRTKPFLPRKIGIAPTYEAEDEFDEVGRKFNHRIEAYLIGSIRSDGVDTHHRFIGIQLLVHQGRTQRPAGIRGVYLSKLLRGSLGNDASTARSSFGPKVNDVICARDHFDVVLHDDDTASSLD